MTKHRAARTLIVATEVALVVFGVAVLIDESVGRSFTTLAIWDAIALAYVAGGTYYISRYGLREEEDEPDNDGVSGDPQAKRPGRRSNSREDHVETELVGIYRSILPLLASLIGLASSITELYTDPSGTLSVTQTHVVGGLAMLLAWLLLHISYGHLYEWLYRRNGSTGLDFPETRRPALTDFLYFSLTIGATFATSDVNVTTRAMRWRVTVHSVLGFFYNAIVLATAVNLLTGR